MTLDELYTASRAASNAYASMDAPHLPDDPWSALQVRLFRWERREYGLQPMAMYALGVIEEMGEYAEAVNEAEREDAMGDVYIFASQLCTVNRLDLGTMARGRWLSIDQGNGLVLAARLAHVALKSAQGIRGMADPEKQRRAVFDALMPILWLYSGSRVDDTLALVTRVAEQVMRRDKSKLPQVRP